MTEEQIKQNALAYATENYGEYDEHDYTDHSGSNMCHAVSEEAFIAGAHSRDEEIGRMNTTIRLYANQIAQLRKEIEQLRNPWKDASVEKPPYDPDCDDETSVYVIVRQEQGNVLEAYYDYDNNDWRDREHNWRLQDPTHWMPIPELKKGE